MVEPRASEAAGSERDLRRLTMRMPDEVAVMLELKRRGWGVRKIAAEFGACPKTVRAWIKAGGWRGYKRPGRPKKLDGLSDWLEAKMIQHRGNADVVRQDLKEELAIEATLRTVERAVAPLRQRLEAERRATVRFETAPGLQMQIDFGETRVELAGVKERVHLFVATLGYSRRGFVQAFLCERQSAWFEGMENAFRHFDGVPQEVLFDNARALVDHHDPATREVTFNARFHAFARYWGFAPKACAPYRPRTKGKDESGVGYAKKNAVAGRRFDRTTGEAPIVRFLRDEAAALQPFAHKPPFCQVRDLVRRVQADCCVEVDRAAYSVPWRLIGERVAVAISDGRVRITHAGRIVAEHKEGLARERVCDREHFKDVGHVRRAESSAAPAVLLRPLEEYEAIAGGRW